MSEMIELVAKAIQAKCKERGYRECPEPLVHHVAGAALEAVREHLVQCAKRDRAQAYYAAIEEIEDELVILDARIAS